MADYPGPPGEAADRLARSRIGASLAFGSRRAVRDDGWNAAAMCLDPIDIRLSSADLRLLHEAQFWDQPRRADGTIRSSSSGARLTKM
jgi:hypothetical protein